MKGTTSSRSEALRPNHVRVPVAFGGLLNRRERWGLSWRGWFVGASTVLICAILFIFGVHPFLAVNNRLDANILIVEGWVHFQTLRAAAEEFKRGGYTRVLTTAGPGEAFEPSNGAQATLIRSGVPLDRVEKISADVSNRDRTFNAALGIKSRLDQEEQEVKRINILTEGLHARRTRLLFQKALGPGIDVGVLSIPSADYDRARWWRYSAGVKAVLLESVSYVYAVFLFRAPSVISQKSTSIDQHS